MFLRTTDGGNRWEKRAVAADARFNGVSFSDASVAVAVGLRYHGGGQEGIIFRTTDGGTTWKELPKQTASMLRAVSFTAGGSETPSVTAERFSHDRWGGHVVQSGWCCAWLPVLRQICGLQDGTAVGAGQDNLGNPYGMILRTTDGGATWLNQPCGTRSALHGSLFSDANRGTAVGWESEFSLGRGGGEMLRKRRMVGRHGPEKASRICSFKVCLSRRVQRHGGGKRL